MQQHVCNTSQCKYEQAKTINFERYTQRFFWLHVERSYLRLMKLLSQGTAQTQIQGSPLPPGKATRLRRDFGGELR